jgi:hypothetical protein
MDFNLLLKIASTQHVPRNECDANSNEDYPKIDGAQQPPIANTFRDC